MWEGVGMSDHAERCPHLPVTPSHLEKFRKDKGLKTDSILEFCKDLIMQ